MKARENPLVWLHGEIKTPRLSSQARTEAGYLFASAAVGEKLSLPHSRVMKSIGVRCYELRIDDVSKTWRIVYRIDADAIVILDVFEKKTHKTVAGVIENCKRRIRLYDS